MSKTLTTDDLNLYMNQSMDSFEEALNRALDLWNTGHPKQYIRQTLETEFHLEPRNASRIELMAETLTYDVKNTYK